MKAFPKPLTKEEEQKLLSDYQAGSTDAMEKLILHNLRLVAHMVKKYPLSYNDTEDMLSMGIIGLIKAVQSFNPQKNCRLATYASRCIENELLMYLRGQKKHDKTISLMDTINADSDGCEIILMEVIENHEDDPYTHIEQMENIKKLYETLSSLSKREQYILINRYGLLGQTPKTQQELSTILGISRSYISRIENGAIKKLRPFFL